MGLLSGIYTGDFCQIKTIIEGILVGEKYHYRTQGFITYSLIRILPHLLVN